MSESFTDTVNTDCYIHGVRQIVWGLVIVLLDIRLNGFDILPDVIGYLLVALGLGKLMPLNEHFKYSRIFAILLIPFVIPSLYESPGAGLFAFGFTSLGLFLMLWGVVSTILKLFMVYYICLGVAEVASSQEESASFAMIARGRWRNYVFLNGAFLACQPFILNIPEQTAIIPMLIAIPFLIVIEIMIINLIHRFGKEVISVPDPEIS